jgi:hypothetical protein
MKLSIRDKKFLFLLIAVVLVKGTIAIGIGTMSIIQIVILILQDVMTIHLCRT